jgi:RNA polymerase sigma factor (sigma-70 family)
MIAATLPRPPHFIYHPSFETPEAAEQLGWDGATDVNEATDRYMPDDVTRDTARRMHYAAWRLAHCDAEERPEWLRRYLWLRDRIVLGNRKLVYRAVRRRMAMSNRADDLIGDCQIVLIQAVAAFNPWMGIRFSTYAYTCLVRALSRLSQRLAGDRLSRSLSLDTLPDGLTGPGGQDEPNGHTFPRLDEFLREDHPLLSAREKAIISRRFCLNEQPTGQTLEKVGRELGLSKERVRQVQATALGKLRRALLDEVRPCS